MIEVVCQTLADKKMRRRFKKDGVVKTAYAMQVGSENVNVIVSIEKDTGYDELTVKDLKKMSADYFYIEKDVESGVTTLHFEVKE
ncbi:hypothetical protein [Methanorbis furvi]